MSADDDNVIRVNDLDDLRVVLDELTSETVVRIGSVADPVVLDHLRSADVAHDRVGFKRWKLLPDQRDTVPPQPATNGASTVNESGTVGSGAQTRYQALILVFALLWLATSLLFLWVQYGDLLADSTALLTYLGVATAVLMPLVVVLGRVLVQREPSMEVPDSDE